MSPAAKTSKKARVQLHGHLALRERLYDAAKRGTLPASLLLQGPRGVGKQQLALWLGRQLVCEHPDLAPCEECQSCRFSRELTHPDLHWFFPRPRPKDPDPTADDVREDYADAVAERMAGGGLYEPPSGTEGIFVATVRAIVQMAVMSPAVARRKVFVIGDAERMVPQEGSDQAANAFLKLLEEPPADTTIILTSSEPGALLPTIRSRVVTIRVPALAEPDVLAFLADEAVVSRLGSIDANRRTEIAQSLGGAPGRLMAKEAWDESIDRARALLDAAASHDRGNQLRFALAQGVSKARGSFSDVLEAMTFVLHQRARGAANRGSEADALGAAKAVQLVAEAKDMAGGNVSPQLITASLLRRIAPLVR